MDEITKTNTTRILKFLQPYKLDFNEYSIWNYSRKKFKDEANTRPLLNEAIEFLAEKGYVESVRREGYYRLTAKGKYFENWEIEKIDEIHSEIPKKVQKSWMNWLMPNKSEFKEA